MPSQNGYDSPSIRVIVGGSYSALEFAVVSFCNALKPQLCSRATIGSKIIDFIFHVINKSAVFQFYVKYVGL